MWGSVRVGPVLAWCLVRRPGAVKNGGAAARALVFVLIGAGMAFTLFSVVHWTVELTSVALAASAVAGRASARPARVSDRSFFIGAMATGGAAS